MCVIQAKDHEDHEDPLDSYDGILKKALEKSRLKIMLVNPYKGITWNTVGLSIESWGLWNPMEVVEFESMS